MDGNISVEEISEKKSEIPLLYVNGFYFPEYVVKRLPEIKNFEIRKEDIWVISFPKSGTTWCQELIFMAINDCDTEKAKSKILVERFPFIDGPLDSIDFLNSLQSPRLIKTHLPIQFLPEEIENKCKVIYVIRNPKDVAVSLHYFLHLALWTKYNEDIKNTLKIFLQGKVPWGPWSKHVNEFTNKKKILIVHYEEIHRNPRKQIHLLCEFLNRNLDDRQIDLMIEWCSFETMKKNPFVNYEWYKASGRFKKDGDFFRKGKVGDWMNHFTEKESNEFDLMVKENLLYNYQFDYGSLILPD